MADKDDIIAELRRTNAELLQRIAELELQLAFLRGMIPFAPFALRQYASTDDVVTATALSLPKFLAHS